MYIIYVDSSILPGLNGHHSDLLFDGSIIYTTYVFFTMQINKHVIEQLNLHVSQLVSGDIFLLMKIQLLKIK